REAGVCFQELTEFVQEVIDPLMVPLDSRGCQQDEPVAGNPQFGPKGVRAAGPENVGIDEVRNRRPSRPPYPGLTGFFQMVGSEVVKISDILEKAVRLIGSMAQDRQGSHQAETSRPLHDERDERVLDMDEIDGFSAQLRQQTERERRLLRVDRRT